MAHILIIDDEELVRMTVAQALERVGHEVSEAADGAEGLAAFRDAGADIVITDIIMPNKEGIETIMELRKIDPGVQIIAISGGGRANNMSFLDVARMLGADTVLKKPFTMETLRRAVDACLMGPPPPTGG